jgi:hypothetical protein
MFHKRGARRPTMQAFDTPFLSLPARTLANASDPDEIRRVSVQQNALTIAT